MGIQVYSWTESVSTSVRRQVRGLCDVVCDVRTTTNPVYSWTEESVFIVCVTYFMIYHVDSVTYFVTYH